MNNFPKDIENIIINYKKEFENYDTQFEKINNIMNNKTHDNCIKINMDYLDFKEFLLINNIYSIKYNLPIYGKDHKNNYGFWDLNFIKDEDYILENYRVTHFMCSNIYKIIYIKLI